MSNKEGLINFLKSAKEGRYDDMNTYIDENAKYIAMKEESDAACPIYGAYIGFEGFKRLFESLKTSFDTQKFELYGITENEDTAMAHGYFEHKVRKTGKLFCSNWAMVSEFSNGKIIQCKFFEDTAALEEAFKS